MDPLTGRRAVVNVTLNSARLQAHAQMIPAYDLIIGSASLFGGFTISASLTYLSKEDEFMDATMFFAYQVLLIITSVLNVYVVVALVLNRYFGARAFKLHGEDEAELEPFAMYTEDDEEGARAVRALQRKKERLFLYFVDQTSIYRASAVWSFTLSLPALMLLLSFRQWTLHPEAAEGAHRQNHTAAEKRVEHQLAHDMFVLRWGTAGIVVLGLLAVLVAVVGQAAALHRVGGGGFDSMSELASRRPSPPRAIMRPARMSAQDAMLATHRAAQAHAGPPRTASIQHDGGVDGGPRPLSSTFPSAGGAWAATDVMVYSPGSAAADVPTPVVTPARDGQPGRPLVQGGATPYMQPASEGGDAT